MQLYVVGIPIVNQDTEVLLIKKEHPDWQKGYLNGIGGKIERDESPIFAMKREFFEEVHITPKLASPMYWDHFLTV